MKHTLSVLALLLFATVPFAHAEGAPKGAMDNAGPVSHAEQLTNVKHKACHHPRHGKCHHRHGHRHGHNHGHHHHNAKGASGKAQPAK